MSKIIDITDKLNFEEKPQIKIKDTTITINNEATAMLKILPTISKKKMDASEIIDVLNNLLNEDEAKKLEALNLDFSDFTKFIEAAVSLIAGNDGTGEVVTPATI